MHVVIRHIQREERMPKLCRLEGLF